MKLNVLGNEQAQPWYADGLSFTCSQCGNCCTGGPGYVWISEVEIDRLADFLQMPRLEVLKRYCRKIGGRISFKERILGPQRHDCVFLEEIESTQYDPRAGREVRTTKRICRVYDVRPLQCRTWPFWPENLDSRRAWNAAARKCPGMSRPGRDFTREQIEALRDSEDWPERPPTSE